MPGTAIVLCGGLAKRMRPLTETIPKCMAPLGPNGGRPLLDYHLEMMDAAGVRHIILAAGYRNEVIKDYYGNEGFTYSAETEPLGTGGAVRKAMEHVAETEFFVINGDDVFPDLNLGRFGLVCTGKNALVSSRFPQHYGIVESDESRKITGFRQKPVLEDVWANTGIYLFQRGIQLPKKGDFETTTFPELVRAGSMEDFRYKGRWLSLNTEKDLDAANAALKQQPFGFRHRKARVEDYTAWLLGEIKSFGGQQGTA